MEAYLEDPRPTLDELCKEYEDCKDCPAYEFCYDKSENISQKKGEVEEL